jgi:transcriptional/translational regulatory protein YebC/TACO1
MASNGSVSWQFDRKAVYSVKSDGKNFDKAFEAALEAGADDVTEEDGYIEIVGTADTFKAIHESLIAAKLQIEDAGVRMIPKQEVELNFDETVSVLKLINAIEENDDVQNVYSNLKFGDEHVEALDN